MCKGIQAKRAKCLEVFAPHWRVGYISQVTLELNTADKDVVVVGLGYVGLTLAAHLANIVFKVHGV